jgi:hypothetical protein
MVGTSGVVPSLFPERGSTSWNWIVTYLLMSEAARLKRTGIVDKMLVSFYNHSCEDYDRNNV